MTEDELIAVVINYNENMEINEQWAMRMTLRQLQESMSKKTQQTIMYHNKSEEWQRITMAKYRACQKQMTWMNK